MPGSLTISTLSDGSNTADLSNMNRGMPRARVNWIYVSSVVTIFSSFNASSVTYAGSTGQHNISFTTSFSDANWCFGGGTCGVTGGGYYMMLISTGALNSATLRTSSQTRVVIFNNAGAQNVYDLNLVIVR